MAAFKEVPHGVADDLQAGFGAIYGKTVPRGAGLPPALSLVGPSVRRFERARGRRCAAPSACGSIIPTALPRLRHRQCALESVVAVGITPQPLGRRPARRERAGNRRFACALGGVAPTGPAADFLARHRARVAGAVTIAPTHEIHMHMIVMIDV